MGDFFYLRPNDDLVKGNATLEVDSGTEDAEYPAANLGNQNVNKPAKLTTTTGRWKIDLGSAMDVQFAALLVHNLDGSLADVGLFGNATDSWGAPSFSQDFVIPAADVAGFPTNCFLDLTGGSQSFQWWALDIATANSANLIIGGLILSTSLRQFTRNFMNEQPHDESRPVIEQRTAAGIPGIFQQPTRSRSHNLSWYSLTPDATDFQNLAKSTGGRALQFISGLDLAVNECEYGRLTAGSELGTVTKVLKSGAQGHVTFDLNTQETPVKIPG